MCYLVLYGKTTVDYHEDTVIVLGAGVNNSKPSKTLKARLDACIEYYDKNPDIHIVVTGGTARQKNTTEADVMKSYLVEHGIPKEIILVENKATSTKENYLFSKELLDKNNLPYESIVFITNSFHVYRAGVYAKFCGFGNAHSLAVKTDIFVFLPAVIREVLGVIDMWVFKLK